MAELRKGRIPIFSPLQNTAEATGALAAVTDTDQIWDLEREKTLAAWMAETEQSIQNVIEDSQEMLLVVLSYQNANDFTNIFETDGNVTMNFKPYNKEGFKFIKTKFDAGSSFDSSIINSIPGSITKLSDVPSTGLVAVLAPKYSNGTATWYLYISAMKIYNEGSDVSIALSIPYDIRADLQAEVKGARSYSGTMSCQARTKKFGILIK